MFAQAGLLGRPRPRWAVPGAVVFLVLALAAGAIAQAPPAGEGVIVSRIRLLGTTPQMEVAAADELRIIKHYEETSGPAGPGPRAVTRRSSFRSEGTISAIGTGVAVRFALVTLPGLEGRDTTPAPRGDGPTGLLALALRLANHGTRRIVIDWASATIIAPGGAASGVMRKKTRLDDQSPPVPTTIPPTGSITDWLYPRSLLHREGSDSSGPWRGRQFFETMQTGEKFRLYLPVKLGDAKAEYGFTFQVVDVK